ncbi:hypothetical protein [Paenibacillus thiaminolyticus]|nr:hypothetical protein [Paenibacillus thiaminolyticus]
MRGGVDFSQYRDMLTKCVGAEQKQVANLVKVRASEPSMVETNLLSFPAS